MRRRFGNSWKVVIALGALLAAASAATMARAGDGPEAGARAAPCGPGEACVRIRGYVKAGADDARGAAPPPLLAGVGALGQAAADGLNRGIVMLRVGSEEPR